MRRAALALRPQPSAPVPRTAMVMAAGLGKRMRPLTATRPKPLIEVAGKALIDHVFDRLRAAGVERAVVNVHYLADALEAHLARYASDIEIIVSDERERLLETGGGLVKARHLLGDEPILVVNSDNLWVDGPVDAIRLLADRWDGDVMDALLLVVPFARAYNHPGRGDFHIGGDGRIVARRKQGRVAPFVYTGVQILDPRVIENHPDGPFSTNLFWNRSLEKERLYGVVHQGMWFDVGSPKAIPATEAVLAGG
ncbi:nucleotidyltransferase family protein [Sphingomonas lenta]|uniref:Mannose-1-phosphate guanylyltransferase n=1 Tax=Sphingomonas lenta TaxID=1141887 RepID=A0A2A2SJP0_9SPHN|nr:nucleotidyltransferase family protein [Sphingomonas lenta]PAX09494.1 mannose-1-phosphate guanylyltransferase [Sphingomonas lenta]